MLYHKGHQTMIAEYRLRTFLLFIALLLLCPLGPLALAEPAAPAIEVTVTLDDALRDQVMPGDTLFVYARAAAGPRMPLAIVRLSAADLPATVTLDDSSAMMPNMKLSTFDEVMVLARISRSGDAMTRSGDLQGSTGPVRVEGSARVEVVIDTRAP
jgi:cytochrome c-type biogenesis protein CcmH